MITSKYILPLLLFLLTLAAGFWVSKAGKPYNTGIFTLHKLLALAVVVLTTIAISGFLKTTQATSLITILIILAGLSVVALFATGALMSIQKTDNNAWLLIHQIAPFVLTGSTIAVILLLGKAG
ncbi:MAG: hypothetical protein CVU42_05295 [Chloroflexi bacterium HGW-Chloroflexi-4]|jgi:hypothetical protein|nr:MAG: hypothetical protein CVU42_05295 [Chloroflexi bacterium HGW-Chloroflexi-4]